MQRQFIKIGGNTTIKSTYSKYTYSDLLYDERVIIFDNAIKNKKNRLLNIIKRIHFSNRINLIINLPFKGIWKTVLDDIEWSDDTLYYIIFNDTYPLSPSYLRDIREKHNVKYVLFAEFVWDGNFPNSKRRREDVTAVGFDYIFTFDPKDAKKYGFIYSGIPYSIISDKKMDTINYDLYLIASAADRLDSFLSVYKHVIKNDVSVKYRLTNVKKKKQEFKDKIIYNKRIPYIDAINEVKQSNCILEILSEGQSGASLRYYEAVCYNKKLLTNNKNVVNLPFYNPEYIHVFEKPEDIDCEWVKERIPIDYGYDGRFSPTHLIDKIIELEEEKEG